MTQSKFFLRDGALIGFELSGHTGKNIVCAAVSSAAYMTVNTLTDVVGVKPDIDERDGYLRVVLPWKDAPRGRDLLEGFRLHLTELQKQYPHQIKVTVIEAITEV